MSTARKLLPATTRRGALLVAVVAIISAPSVRADAKEARSSPFFPIGLYSVDDPKDFPEVARAGFNLIQSYRFEGIPPWGKTDPQAKEFLDAADSAGLRVFVGLPQEAVQEPGDAGKQDLRLIQSRVRAFRDHPALWGWSIFDEPESAGYGRQEPVRPVNFNKAYQAIKKLDASHPVLTIPNGAIDDTYPYLGVDAVLTQYSMLPAGIYDAPWDSLENLKAAHSSTFETLKARGTPFFWSVQVYNLANDPAMWPDVLARHSNAVGRYPTKEEIRYMAFMGIIQGAQGVVFVCYKTQDENGKLIENISGKGNPKQWQAVSSISAELKSMIPILLAPAQPLDTAGVTIAGETKVAMMLKQHEGSTYLLTANASESAAQHQIRLAPARFPNPKISLLQEGSRIPWQSSGGSFDAKWPPYGVYVFEIR